MAKPPIVTQIQWRAVALQLLIYAAAVAAASIALGRDSNPVLVGVFPIFMWSLASRYLVARHQRRGVRLMKAHRYDAAIPSFEASYEFFSRHRWLDRYRAILLMSASAIPYREMALANIAFCHSQAGRGAEAKAAYQRTLNEFPSSGLAEAALRLIGSVENARSSSGAA